MDQELLSIVLLVILIFVIVILIHINDSKTINTKIRNRILKDLKHIEKLIETKNPLVYRDALIRLDSLLSKSLQTRFKNKKSCGENLKQADFFDKKFYDRIWEVHKLRNEVVHEDKEVNLSDLQNSFKIIRKAIDKIL